MAVAYVTDLEGMWERLRTFADGNPQVWIGADGALELATDVTFVFGGDAIDRGPSGRRIVRLLLDAKRRYGERMVLLAGNRDINKLRLARELDGHPPAKAPAGLGRPDLLRWIFEHTMGARGAFEFRRTELGGVGDDDVVDSYLADLAPGGDQREYLLRCQLAFAHEKTLYVHGGLSSESLGNVPTVGRIAEPHAWIAGLNRWYLDQLDAFVTGRMDDGRPAWSPLIAYQAPVSGLKINPGSVVYSRSADELNNPLLPAPEVIARLVDAGLPRVVVGHTPNGDSPAVVRDPASGVELYSADNSYARHDLGSRIAIGRDELTIAAFTKIDGDTTLHPLALTLRLGETGPIGLRTPDGKLVKGQLTNGNYVMFRYLPGYQTEQTVCSAHDLENQRLAPPTSMPYKV